MIEAYKSRILGTFALVITAASLSGCGCGPFGAYACGGYRYGHGPGYGHPGGYGGPGEYHGGPGPEHGPGGPQGGYGGGPGGPHY
ncbi:MAG: hypothetical protein PHT60_06855 [Acidiphilium sp.]|nr:hypothetical protein [Acidiphilium sp.]MDD4935482.1 hypothetical protein [Acidiphilium sp.]